MTTETTHHHYFHVNPTSPARARLEEAEGFFLAGNYNESLAAAQQAWREFPQEPDVYRIIAYIHMVRGEYPPAAQAAYQAVVFDRDNPSSYATLSQVYLTFHMMQLAEDTLKVAHDRFPDDPALSTLLADVYFRRGQNLNGEQLALSCLARNPGDAYAKALLGKYRLAKKKYAEAAAYYADVVEVYPSRWDYLRDYGVALLHRQQVSAAIGMLDRSLQLNMEEITIKQHYYLALRMELDQTWYWRVAFTFFAQPALGWLTAICGAIATVVGIGWLSASSLYDASAGRVLIGNGTDASTLVLPLGLFIAGLGLLILPWPGTMLAGAKGDSLDERLAMQIDRRLERLGETG